MMIKDLNAGDIMWMSAKDLIFTPDAKILCKADAPCFSVEIVVYDMQFKRTEDGILINKGAQIVRRINFTKANEWNPMPMIPPQQKRWLKSFGGTGFSMIEDTNIVDTLGVTIKNPMEEIEEFLTSIKERE